MTSSYYPGDYMEWQDNFTKSFLAMWGFRRKLEGPVGIWLNFVFPLPESLSKKERADRLGKMWHIQKPDVDNLEKAILDGMSKAGIWGDDCQVCSIFSQKVWGPTGEIHVEVQAL